MNQLDASKRGQVLSALCEGNSIRAVSRMFDISRNTISKLLVEAGAACAEYQDMVLRNLSCKRVQCDEIWAFIGAKDKNVPADRKDEFGIGSVWTWTAIDADTKLICSWMVGDRSANAANEFMKDLAGRLNDRIQLTTDGHHVYVDAVDKAFGSEIDYAMLIKLYGGARETEARYSPAECIGCERKEITGKPDKRHVSTSYVERQNLTMRMGMRRFTRLTNAFSKKLENHIAAVSLYFMHYNFVKIHGTLRVTPAMAAGVSDHPWDVSDIVELLADYQDRLERERKSEREARLLGTLDPSRNDQPRNRKFAKF